MYIKFKKQDQSFVGNHEHSFVTIEVSLKLIPGYRITCGW